MARYKLKVEEAVVPEAERQEVTIKELLNLGIKRQVDFMLKNSNAETNSIKVLQRWQQKFRLIWKDKTTGLYCAKSYAVYINDKGVIISRGVSGLKVTQEAEKPTE